MEYFEIVSAPNGMTISDKIGCDIISHSNGVYLHGELESKIGNDLFYWVWSKPDKEGIYSIDLTDDYTSETYTAIGYIWHVDGRGRMRGLVIDPTDLESTEYAIKCYKEKREFL